MELDDSRKVHYTSRLKVRQRELNMPSGSGRSVHSSHVATRAYALEPFYCPYLSTHGYRRIANGNLGVSDSQTVMLEVLGRVDVLDIHRGLCRNCSLMDTSVGNEDTVEASGTPGYTRMVILPEDWTRLSVSPARLVELARSERGEHFPNQTTQ